MSNTKSKPHDENKCFDVLGSGLAVQEMVRLKLPTESTNGHAKPRPLSAHRNELKKDRSILLVEDDSIDVKTVKRAFRDLEITNPLVIVGNGAEALEYLEKENTMPFLILLDLNTPSMNGIEFLRVFMKNRKYEKIAVVVLTTSKAETDRMECAQLGVSGYFIKAIDYKDFLDSMSVTYRYWTLNQLFV